MSGRQGQLVVSHRSSVADCEGTQLTVPIALALLLMCADANAAPPSSLACKNSPHLVGPCFTVHGRLAVYNGSNVFRIWPIGTHRLIAIVNVDDRTVEPVLPPEIEGPLERGTATGVALFGDYEVCPVTRQKPGTMQDVCLIRGTNLIAKSLGMGPAPAPPR